MESRESVTCVFIKQSSRRHVESMKNKNRDVFINLGLIMMIIIIFFYDNNTNLVIKEKNDE